MKKFWLFFVVAVLAGFSADAAPVAKTAAPPAPAAPAAFMPSVTNVIGAPHNWGWDFQPDVTPLSHHMHVFNTYITYIIAIITLVVLSLITYIIIRFHHKRNPVPSKTAHNTLLEIIWTTIPIIVVIAIVIPSIKLLYYADRTEKADMTLKVVGYQWYWSYELPDQKVKEFESRVIPEDKLLPGQRRLMEVDDPLVLPVGKTVRVLVTADPLGVIHSWGVPGLSFKRDAMPGRINEGWIRIEQPGIYYGECYQLCGVDHAFMPIKIIGVTPEEFDRWVVSKQGTPGYASNELTVSTSTPGKNAGDADATTSPKAEPNLKNDEPPATAAPVKEGKK